MKKLILSAIICASLIIPNITLGAKTLAVDPGKLQNLGATMIDKRVAAIAKYDSLLAKTKYVTETTLTQVRGELSRVSSELGTLKTKIQGETDIAILKADIKSIVNNYRVYQVFLPQSAGIVSVDRMKTYEAKLNELKNKISQKADELEGQGKDASAIRNLISLAEGNISTGTGHIATAESKFTSMTIADPEGARTLKLEGRTALISAKQSFSEARKNMRDAVQEIKKLAQPGI
ncbi:MAG: hypothetical protein AAB525_03295 [Patescibacteria group bacterium]